MKGKKSITIGNLVKKTSAPGEGRLGVVIAQGADQTQTILADWVRIRYIIGGGYEWIKKSAIELIL